MNRLLGTDTTLNRIGLRPGQRVLEVGPGPGRLLLRAAQQVLPGGDATQSHFPPECFDVIFLCTVLGEIPEREVALSQCYQALKPGGRLSITELFPDPHFQRHATVRRLAESVGFTFMEVRGSWYFFTMNFTKDPASKSPASEALKKEL